MEVNLATLFRVEEGQEFKFDDGKYRSKYRNIVYKVEENFLMGRYEDETEFWKACTNVNELTKYRVIRLPFKPHQKMRTYGFEVAHGYEILKGVVDANSEEEAKAKILEEEWEDIIDSYDTDECAIGYEIIDIWKVD